MHIFVTLTYKQKAIGRRIVLPPTNINLGHSEKNLGLEQIASSAIRLQRMIVRATLHDYLSNEGCKNRC